MIYEIGTISTKANDPKITGKNTLWKNNVTKVSVGQIILIQAGNTIYQNSIRSVESDTQMTLSFPVPVTLSDVKYVISITMIGSVSDGVNKSTAMVTESYQLMTILNRLMTESGVIKVALPDGTEMQLRTEKERDRLLDGKLDQSLAEKISGDNVTWKGIHQFQKWANISRGDYTFSIIQLDETQGGVSRLEAFNAKTKERYTSDLPKKTGTLMHVGDFGVGLALSQIVENATSETLATGFYGTPGGVSQFPGTGSGCFIHVTGGTHGFQIGKTTGTLDLSYRLLSNKQYSDPYVFYSTRNTTRDANGNLKAASPIVKVFADHIETNDEAEGVTMQKLGTGHYLIKGVVGFNSDGAWGINNGLVIPQDHNGKNMVLIDYEVRPDGDIEVFVFHQQNADLPERFQNKRIKHLDEDGNPVYYENYEPCDVPESRWIDMRVEMPVNSIYNLKQAEAERLAKEEAERQAEEAKNAEIEAEEDI